MIDIYAWGTTNGLRATVALAECELPHRVIPIDLAGKANRTPEYLAINSTGQIPTLIDHDAEDGPMVLAQSGAIVLYVCAKARRFMPAAQADQFVAMKWFMQAATDIGGASAGLQQVAVVATEKVPSTITLFQQRLVRYFTYVDEQLEGRDFLAGEISVADFMMYPNYALRSTLLESLADLPRLRQWAARMALRPGVQAGMQLAAG